MERDLETAVARGQVMGSLFGDAQPEPRLGRYRLRRLLGRGAHGRVFEAHDPELDRVVAIKVAHEPDGSDDTTREIRDREAQALARLSHPNVVQVFDVGVADGSLYVVMELVEGEDLASFVARDKPALDELVAIFVSAGRGLAAAHGEGLRHGDFKPGNVLVGDDAVKVADFGLAHLIVAPTNDGGTVDTLRHAGTPLYMAPEQLRGDSSGPQADEYAFCVALWESICGTPPFEGVTPMALLHAKERGPGVVPAAIPRALGAVLRRGLAPDPGSRHRSVDALLDALERSVRPRRAPLRMAAVVAAVVVGGGLALGLRDPEVCTVSSPWDEAHRLELSEQLSRFAPSDARSALAADVRVYGQRWQTARDAVCEAEARGAAIECLDSAAFEMEATVEAFAGIEAEVDLERYARPAVRQLPDPQACLARRRSMPTMTDARVAQAIARVRALQRLGRSKEAVEPARSAVTLALALDMDSQARAQWELGRALAVVGDMDDAKQHLEEAFFAARSAGRPELAILAAALLADHGLRSNDLEAADEWLRHAEAELEHVDDPIRRVDVLQGRANLFIVAGRLEDARAVLDEALTISDGRGYEAGPLFFARAQVHQGLGDLESAEADLRHALAVEQERVGSDHPELIATHAMLGITLMELGRYDEARVEIEAAAALGRKWLLPQSDDMGRLHEALGMLAQGQGQPEVAEAEHRRALEIRRAILPDDHPAIAASQYNLGLAASAQGRFAEAVELHRQALRRYEAMDGAQAEIEEVTTALADALNELEGGPA